MQVEQVQGWEVLAWGENYFVLRRLFEGGRVYITAEVKRFPKDITVSNVFKVMKVVREIRILYDRKPTMEEISDAMDRIADVLNGFTEKFAIFAREEAGEFKVYASIHKRNVENVVDKLIRVVRRRR